jgi:3-methyladenine DNA glycosylase/8-oxoguanine DNA glycosylase
MSDIHPGLCVLGTRLPCSFKAFEKALEPHTSKELTQMAEAWRPWRSYATINLWNSL